MPLDVTHHSLMYLIERILKGKYVFVYLPLSGRAAQLQQTAIWSMEALILLFHFLSFQRNSIMRR